MAKARVSLLDTGPVSFYGGGHTLRRGENLTLTEPADILYFQRQSGVALEMLEGEPPKAAKAISARAEIAPVPKGKAKGKPPKSEPPPPPPEKEDPVDGKFSADQLAELTADAICDLIDALGFERPDSDTTPKAELVKMALDAQDAVED